MSEILSEGSTPLNLTAPARELASQIVAFHSTLCTGAMPIDLINDATLAYVAHLMPPKLNLGFGEDDEEE